MNFLKISMFVAMAFFLSNCEKENTNTPNDQIPSSDSYVKVDGAKLFNIGYAAYGVVNSWETDSTGRFMELMLFSSESEFNAIWNNTPQIDSEPFMIITLISDANNVGKLEGVYENDGAWADQSDARTAPDYCVAYAGIGRTEISDPNYWIDLADFGSNDTDGGKVNAFEIVKKSSSNEYSISGSLIMIDYSNGNTMKNVEIVFDGVIINI